jgi:fatty acid synthase subunit beta
MERASESNRALASSESKHDGVEAEGEGKWGGEKEEEEEEQWKGVEEQGSTAQGSTSLPFLTSKPLHLAYGLLKYTWLLPELISSRAASIRDTFIEPLPPAVAELSYDERPSSVVELAIRFLHFLALDIKPTNDRFGDLKHTLAVAFNQFEAEFLQYDELHTLVANQVKGHAKRLAVIGAYYEVRHVLGRPVHLYEPNMLRAARLNDAKIFAIFGGQGNTEDYFSELREVYLTYRHFVHDFLHYGSQILLELSASLETEGLFPKGFDIMRWLQYPAEQPLADYLIPAPVSFPLIGLLQLTQYALTCKLLGIDPGTFRERLSGLSGHSQGIIAAMVVSVAGTWESFNATAKTALVVLFWVGVRSQEAFPRTTIPPSLLEESLSHDEGSPTPMLSVRNLSRETLQQQIDLTNKHLSEQRQMHIGLFNGPRSFVVSGPPTSLCGLNAHLRDIKAPSGIDQTRVPFSERKAVFTHVFLPVSVPFHSPYLRKACAQVLEDLGELYISSFSLRVPLFATDDGSVLGSEKSAREELLPRLVRMIMCEPVKWQEATEFLNATHILDFGPGGRSGAGLIVYQNKEGSGVRVISACSVSQNSKEIAHIHELLDRNRNRPINYNTSWQRQYGPRLVKTAAGRVYVDTKFSRLLGLDHLMVAGMTPCTVPEDFVAATMNAGYHIELAGGGYYDPQKLANAVRRIARSVVPGRTITVNIVYVNPHAVSWQIPVIKQLRLEGLPVDGLTIGAGIPTLEVAAQYITSLGLRHIAFKPSSVETIQQVIQIAKIDEAFPIILQWTGGRGGGHHSYEDFHQPVVQMYAKIRECPNIILVAGSGFGGAEDTYPYITGKWAVDLKLSRSPMPFDGILLGSRMMIAKEAHTSTAAKQLIVNTEGSDDVQWEKTYRGSHGGILTVRSEMGEPIHKIATRGVKLWAELDSTIFSLDRSKRVAELQRRREEIIKRLEDYQKVWFGKSSSGKPVDVDEMTYAEVLNRMADLLYVKHQSRWIHISYQGLLSDFIRRTEERFMSKKAPSMIQNRTELKDPLCTIRKVVSVYPKCQQHLVTAQDAEYFLLLCQKRGQKPVPFVPALDENFEIGSRRILSGSRRTLRLSLIKTLVGYAFFKGLSLSGIRAPSMNL